MHTASDINHIIAQSKTAYGSPGFLYIHDQDCDDAHGAVYSRLPPYFEQVVSALDTTVQTVVVTDPSSGRNVPVVLAY